MAQQTITRSASASLTASGQTTATGSIYWTAPALPEGVAGWDSIILSGAWSWNGRGSISSMTISGRSTSDSVAFSIPVSSSPVTVQCRGNKNATGSSFTWSGLTVTYAYTTAGGDVLQIKVEGQWVEATAVYVKQAGTWVKQDDLQGIFDASKKYILVSV